jgi:hypothetical protein
VYRFNDRLITFEDRVEVVMKNGNGPNDRLNCSWLGVHLSPRGDAAQAGEGAIGGQENLSALEVHRFVAKGAPAMLDAPSYNATARGGVLKYDIRRQRFQIEDPRQVFLRYEQSEIQAREIDYTIAEAGQLGQLHAFGPGRLRGTLPDMPGKTFEAEWQERLVVQPHQGDQAISLVSRARIRYQEMGEFRAERLHVWLRELSTPPGPDGRKRFSYRPDRLLAEDNVHINSVPLKGSMQRAEIWVAYEAVPRHLTTHPNAVAAGSSGTGGESRPGPPTGERRTPASTYHVVGRHVQIQLLRRGPETFVQDLVMDGDVRLHETPAAGSADEPLSIMGTLVQVDGANTANARARIQGHPAQFSARGLTISGEDIRLNRGDNRMVVPGRGQMRLSAKRTAKPSGRSALPGSGMASPLVIAWGGGMEFDGRTARFHRDVQVNGQQMSKSGEIHDLMVMGSELGVTLTHRVDFSKNKQHPDMDLQQLGFTGGAFLQNRTSKLGTRTSLEQMQVRNLTINQQTGRLHAYGPGWGTSVRYRNEISEPRVGSQQAGRRQPELVFTRVEFEDEVVGNTINYEAEFRGNVKTVYGPVARWEHTLDTDPRDGVGEGQFLMTSDRLAVARMGSSGREGEENVETVASGNATIEGEAFVARGARVSYAQAKRMMILEGDGRTDAELWIQGSTTPDAAAQQIRFWTDSYRFQVHGARFLDLSQLGTIAP